MFRRAVESALAAASTGVPEPNLETLPQQLYDTLKHLWSFLTSASGQAVRRLVDAEQLEFPELAALYTQEVVNPFERKVVEIVRRGSEAGHFRELAPEVAARMLTALVLQHADWHHSRPPALQTKTSQVVLREVFDFYLQAIAATDAAFPQADGAPGPRGALNN